MDRARVRRHYIGSWFLLDLPGVAALHLRQPVHAREDAAGRLHHVRIPLGCESGFRVEVRIKSEKMPLGICMVCGHPSAPCAVPAICLRALPLTDERRCSQLLPGMPRLAKTALCYTKSCRPDFATAEPFCNLHSQIAYAALPELAGVLNVHDGLSARHDSRIRNLQEGLCMRRFDMLKLRCGCPVRSVT